MDISRPLASLAALCIAVAGVGGLWRFVADSLGTAAPTLTAALVVAVVVGLAALGAGRVRRRSTPYW